MFIILFSYGVHDFRKRLLRFLPAQTQMIASLEKRKATLIKLGEIFKLSSNDEKWPGYSIGINEDEFDEFNLLLRTVKNHNGWFSLSMIKAMLKAWSNLLTQQKLDQWLSSYSISNADSFKTIAIICAGNIPMVAFHDFICVYLNGNSMKLKLSSDDNVLIPAVIGLMSKYDADIYDQVDFVKEKLIGFDAVIATGSNNTLVFCIDLCMQLYIKLHKLMNMHME